ncbi:hypothetical protein ES705_40455 [subsurface metagenome]
MGYEGLKSGFSGSREDLFPTTGSVLTDLATIMPSLSQLTEQHSSPPGKTATPDLTIPLPTVSKAAELTWLLIEDCEDAWDEYVQANVTSTADAADKIVGAASSKLDVAVDVAVGRLATEAFAPKDLSPYKYLKVWLKSSIAINGGDLDIMLDDHAQCVSPLKELAIPALSADTWTQFALDMGDTSGLTAIISIGIDMNNDKGAFIFHTDQVRATESP